MWSLPSREFLIKWLDAESKAWSKYVEVSWQLKLNAKLVVVIWHIDSVCFEMQPRKLHKEQIL